MIALKANLTKSVGSNLLKKIYCVKKSEWGAVTYTFIRCTLRGHSIDSYKFWYCSLLKKICISFSDSAVHVVQGDCA